jgi:hypothetical protein
MEMVIGTEPEIDNSVVVRGTTENIMWQKERLINLAIEQLPPKVKYVCWIDHDIVFENPNWLVEACEMIEAGFDAVQPFDTIDYLDLDRHIIRSSTGAASVALSGKTPGTGPGACWVASRRWLDSIGGVYDRNVVGGGDAVFFEAISLKPTQFIERQPEACQFDVRKWTAAIPPVKMGFVKGNVQHLWHGEATNRQYISRDAILCEYDFDPCRDIEVDERGLLRWTVSAPSGLRDSVREYFSARREDG